MTIKQNYPSLGLATVNGTPYAIYTDPEKQWLFMAHPTLLAIETQITVKMAQKVSNGVTGRSNWLDQLAKKAYELYITFTNRI